MAVKYHRTEISGVIAYQIIIKIKVKHYKPKNLPFKDTEQYGRLNHEHICTGHSDVGVPKSEVEIELKENIKKILNKSQFCLTLIFTI